MPKRLKLKKVEKLVANLYDRMEYIIQKIPDHLYRILIVGGSGSGKTIALLNLVNHGPDIDKMYLDTKHPYKAKYQLLINKRESTGMIQKLLLNTQMIWMTFVKILKNTIQIKNENVNYN